MVPVLGFDGGCISHFDLSTGAIGSDAVTVAKLSGAVVSKSGIGVAVGSVPAVAIGAAGLIEAGVGVRSTGRPLISLVHR
jgi:hypothetical protein